jgi:hypothetical protein
MGDGSERGEYVGQDYLLRTLGRPHRSINLMYCYYPFDAGWPKRASLAHPRTTDYAWAYPYDDYFPYEGGSGGRTDGHPFDQIRDIRRHGQDVTLTLTIDCAVPESELRVIARELSEFGRLRLRINHECDGAWFAHNKRYTHRQIAEFFIRFHNVIKQHAPQVQTMCCWGSVDAKTGALQHFDDLAPMLRHADIWSMDRYTALHWAWPFNVCEADQENRTWYAVGGERLWKEMHTIYEAFAAYAGTDKPLELGELNYDGDVPGGAAGQQRDLCGFYQRVIDEKPKFLRGITFYQFRDRGRLGLEQEDPNDPSVGVPVPFLTDYRRLIQQAHYSPAETWTAMPADGPLRMSWRHAEDSDGLGWTLGLTGRPTFLEIRLPKALNGLLRVGQSWFYKKPGYEWVDATAAGDGARNLTVALFGPPADGGAGGTVQLPSPPEFRIRY